MASSEVALEMEHGARPGDEINPYRGVEESSSQDPEAEAEPSGVDPLTQEENEER